MKGEEIGFESCFLTELNFFTFVLVQTHLAAVGA